MAVSDHPGTILTRWFSLNLSELVSKLAGCLWWPTQLDDRIICPQIPSITNQAVAQVGIIKWAILQQLQVSLAESTSVVTEWVPI